MTHPTSGETAARIGWRAAVAIGTVAEGVAALPVSGETARAILRGLAAAIGHGDEATRARAMARSPTVFHDRARDAAAAFGAAGAEEAIFPVLAALVEGIKIIDDIQDEEPRCLAADVGIEPALRAAVDAFAFALALTADLPFLEDAWRAATAAIGRGLRETSHGQELEADTTTAGFHTFWEIVDRKTPPLLAAALELGALAAGASPSEAAALNSLAIPMGRVLQIGDDCNDALAPDAPDWRTPHRNLLMLYALTGPTAPELSALLSTGPATLHEAQLLLLGEGALAYALHAQLSALASVSETLSVLTLPNPTPFHAYLTKHRTAAERLLLRTGVELEVAGRVCGVEATAAIG